MRLRVALGCAMFLAAAAQGVAEDAFEPNPSLARLRADDAYARRTARSLRDAGIERASAIRLDGSGRLLVAGTTKYVPWDPPRVARLDADGRLDATFGNGGVVEIPVRAWSHGLSVDAAGRIVLDGSLYGPGTNPYESAPDFAVARLRADGSLDTDFSGDGFVGSLPAPGVSLAGSVRLTGGDGAMLAVAEKAGADSYTLVGLVRIAADGTVDSTYGDGGFAVVAQWWGDAYFRRAFVTDFAVDSAGRAAVVVTDPSISPWPGVRRLDAAGALDPPLSTTYGWWDLPTFAATRIELDGQDRIVGLGPGSVFRRLADGAPDASFSGDGYAWRVEVAGFQGGIPTWQHIQSLLASDPDFDPASEAPLLAVATQADRWVLAKPDPYYEVKGRQVGAIRIHAMDPADSGAIITADCVSPTRRPSGVSGLLVTPDGTTAYALGHTTSHTAGKSSRSGMTVPFVTRVDLTTRKALPLPDLRVRWLGFPHAADYGGSYRVTARVRIRNASRHGAGTVCGYVRFAEITPDDGGPYGYGVDSTLLVGPGTTWAGRAHWRPFRVHPRSSVVRTFTWEGTYGPGGLAGAHLSVRFSGDLPDGNPADNTATSPPISPLYAPPR